MNMKTHILAKKAAAFMLSVVMLASGAQPALASETVETAEDTVQETEETEFDSETETISGETAVTEIETAETEETEETEEVLLSSGSDQSDECIVTFDAGPGYFDEAGGKSSKTRQVKCQKRKRIEGMDIINYEIKIDTSEHKIFGGWATDPEGRHQVSSATLYPEHDVTLYAIWKDAVNVTYDYGDETKVESVFPGKEIYLDETRIKNLYEAEQYSGKMLVGWTLDKGGENTIESYCPESDVTFYAVYKKSWLVKIHLPKEDLYMEAASGQPISLSDYSDVTTGIRGIYGWSTDQKGQNVIQNPDAFVPTTNTDVYPVMEDAWLVTLDAGSGYFTDGRNGHSRTMTVPVMKGQPLADGRWSERTYIATDAASVLTGWSTDREGRHMIRNLREYMPVGNSVLYAVWADAWKVTFDAGSGSLFGERIQKVQKGKNIKSYPLAEADEEGKAFAGWSTEPSGKHILREGDSFTPQKDTTLYAVYKEGCVVTFDGGDKYHGKTWSVIAVKGSPLGKNSIDALSFNKDIIWSEDAEGTKQIENLSGYVPQGDVTLYPAGVRTTKQECYFRLNGNGGVFISDQNPGRDILPIVTDCEVYFLPEGALLKDSLKEGIHEPICLNGRPFLGWAADPEGKEMIRNPENLKMPDELELYAVWGSVPVYDISLEPSAVSLAVGKTALLKARIIPSAAENNQVTWSSSDKKIAAVDDKGQVTAISAGTAVVTVTTADGKKTDQCKVTVTGETWVRLSGATRYDTMKTILGEGFTATGGTVVVATGNGFKDALSAAGLAGLTGAPVLLTDGKTLSDQARQEMERLKPSRVYVIGGEAAVSKAVYDQIVRLTKADVRRLAGENSAETSAAVAKEGGRSWSDTAIIATNRSFADALSAAPLAYALNMPILLADNGTSLNNSVLGFLNTSGISKVIIVGGKLAVTDHVEQELQDLWNIKDIRRIGGATAVDTSAEIARYGLSMGMSVDRMAVATSQNYPDALSGAALCGHHRAVLVLADEKAPANVSFPKPYKKRISRGYILGGEGVVSNRIRTQLERAVK